MTNQPERTIVNSSSVIGFSHIGLSVSDLKASVAFYTEAASLEVDHSKRLSNSAAEKASGFENTPVDRAVLVSPNGYLELSQYEPSLVGPAEELPFQGPGITHICFQSPTSQDIYNRFRKLGATSVSRGTEPVDLGGYGVYYAYGRDADRIMFETEHMDEPHFEGPIWLSHVALVSPDIDRLVEFYQNIIGYEPTRRSDKVSGPRFDDVADYEGTFIRAAWFDMSNMILELWQFVNPVTPEAGAPIPFEKIGYNKFAFEVTDIQSDYKRLVESGVQFLSEPIQTDESTEVFGRDPDGNLFSLIQPAPDSGNSIKALKSRW
jgi:catechol 2,3-dioxygenase-like lactoylglutathione lyase family enzyme